MWTARSRKRYDLSKLRHPSDLTDGEWSCVEQLIPPARRGGFRRRSSSAERGRARARCRTSGQGVVMQGKRDGEYSRNDLRLLCCLQLAISGEALQSVRHDE